MRGQYPSIIEQAERIARDYQGIAEGEGVTIPTWLLAGGIGLLAGTIFGPSIMASTKTGSEKLAELSRQYIERR